MTAIDNQNNDPDQQPTLPAETHDGTGAPIATSPAPASTAMPPVPAAVPPTGKTRYDGLAMLFHWVLAIAIIGTFSVGWYMADLPFSLTRLKLFNWHKWAGVTILALSALRLLWRLTHRPPADLPMPGWQKLGAHAVHWLLYAAFFAVPLSGWAYSSAAGFPIVWFGVLPLPDFVGKDKELAESLKQVHQFFAYGLGLLVLAHLGAVVKHVVLDKDGLLRRMLPGRA
jgi:cytochrome b561